jgi:uncharacterized membrane protein
MASSKSSATRLAFLDWTRGLAAITMLNGHVFHSFAAPEHRDGAAFVLTQFIGGMPPAVFLFLLGVTLSFLMESRERKGVPPGGRVLAALRRAGYLLGVAFLFRVQLFVFGWPGTTWRDLFKVDILNAMGLAILLLSPLAALPAEKRIRAAIGIGLAIAALAPVVSAANTSWLPPFLRSYFVPDYNHFAFFPWASFVAFGVGAGAILRTAGQTNAKAVMQWSALAGLGLIVGGRFFAELPYSIYTNSEFWLNSPMLIFIKLGVLLVALPAVFLWTGQTAGRWSFVRQLGTTSLLVYWVHIELVYGRWFGGWKESLTAGQCAVVSVILILLMVGMSALRPMWAAVRAALASFVYLQQSPERVSGD